MKVEEDQWTEGDEEGLSREGPGKSCGLESRLKSQERIWSFSRPISDEYASGCTLHWPYQSVNSYERVQTRDGTADIKENRDLMCRL